MALTVDCVACGVRLTPALTVLEELPDLVSLSDGVGHAPTVPIGFMAVDPDAVPDFLGGGADERGSSGCLVVNPADAGTLVRHPDVRRNSGCCGHDGLDGPNRLCPSCGTEVATLRDDCWSRVEVRFEPGRIRVCDA